MINLSQIQIHFSETHDRILLRINTIEKEEYRFWLTRRFVKRLFPVLNRSFDNIPEVAAQTTFSNREAVMDFQRQQVNDRVDFQQPFNEKVDTYPLGKSALLISKAKLIPLKKGEFQLSLRGEKNQGAEFNFNSDILYLFYDMLFETIHKTGWDLEDQISPRKRGNEEPVEYLLLN